MVYCLFDCGVGEKFGGVGFFDGGDGVGVVYVSSFDLMVVMRF